MSEWSVDFEDGASDDLEKVSSAVRNQILDKLEWLRSHFLEVNPIPLGGEWCGFFKLRVGDYRIIYDIRWSSHHLIVVVVEHRSRAYKRRN